MKTLRPVLALLALLAGAAPAQAIVRVPDPLPLPVRGKASWYGPGFHGRAMASGRRFDQLGATVAHRTLPFGTRLRLTNLQNGRIAVVTVQDRGPFIPGRILDVSRGVAQRLGAEQAGVFPVELQVLPPE